jgi:catechol 2,3-dioxygenase-like lactoylglutathione lyase family enzyme
VRKLQSQGLHHITLVGADRQTSIDFWEGILGMPFVFEQPNLDNESESHLYFDPGDGRLITVFTNEEREPDPSRTPTDIGCVHHVAFALSQATFRQAVERLDERNIRHSGVKDRGFMDSIYFEDPLGLLIEIASSRRSATLTLTCCWRRTGFVSSAATTTSPRSTSPMRSSGSSHGHASRSRTTARPSTRTP